MTRWGVYDGVNAVQELTGGTVTANLLTGGVDEVFQRTDSPGARIFLTDALGSTLALSCTSDYQWGDLWPILIMAAAA